MAAFDFETLKRKANEVADKGVNLAMKAADIAKNKAKIAKLKAEIVGEKEKARKAYQEIGKIYYHLHKGAPEEGFEDAVADLEATIENLKAKYAQIQELKKDDVGVAAEDAEDAAVVVTGVIPETEEQIEEEIFAERAVEEAAEEVTEAVEEAAEAVEEAVEEKTEE